MRTPEIHTALVHAFDELTVGIERAKSIALNSGDTGLLGGIDRLSHVDASQSANGGATVAAHVLHLTNGLSLMNRWARDGSNPFIDPHWDDAWRTSTVSATEWDAIRREFRAELEAWRSVLGAPRELSPFELASLVGSVAHIAYHLGAIRQIAPASRGPRGGTYT